MATATSAVTNELVMGDAEIQAELGDTGEESVDLTEPDATDTDADVPETWMDSEEGDEEVPGAEGDSMAQSKTAPRVKTYKANGQDVEVDLADQERVDQLITLGLGARPVFSERDKLRKQVGVKDKELAELRPMKDLWNKLEAAKGNHDELYQHIFGKSFKEVIDAEIERRRVYESASPEERKLLDYQRSIEEMKRQMEEQQQSWQQRQKDAETKEQHARQREVRAQFMPEFHKHEFSSKVDDPVMAEKLNTILWRQTVANLKREFGESEQIPQEAIRREFASVASLLEGNAAKRAKAEVSKAVEQKKQQAKTQAQQASTRNYTKSTDKDLAKETDAVKLWRKMFR